MKRSSLFGLACLIVLPSSAHAQLIERACNHMPCSFEQFKTGEADWFQKADANHDGVVDAAEQAAVWQTYAQDLLPACGNMQDIKVLKLDHPPAENNARKDFSAIDVNGDGMIDAGEDQRMTQSINQTCKFLRNPQVQKLQQMFKKWQQGHQ